MVPDKELDVVEDVDSTFILELGLQKDHHRINGKREIKKPFVQ